MSLKISKPLGHSGSSKDRLGTSGGKWGENGPARPITDEYRNGWDRIYGKKNATQTSKQSENPDNDTEEANRD